MNWKKIKSSTVFKHPRLTLVEDEVQLPNGTRAKYLYFGKTNHSVTVICLQKENVLLQREYSYPVGDVLYQFPGGKAEPNETTEAAARRELAEESALYAGQLKLLGWYFTNNRRSAHKMFVYLATDLKETKKQQGDLEESISSEWVDIKTVNKLISTNKIRTYSCLSAWALFKLGE